MLMQLSTQCLEQTWLCMLKHWLASCVHVCVYVLHSHSLTSCVCVDLDLLLACADVVLLLVCVDVDLLLVCADFFTV